MYVCMYIINVNILLSITHTLSTLDISGIEFSKLSMMLKTNNKKS